MAPTERLSSHKVLLVDDDDVIRGLMTESLERKGCEVVSAANVVEALRLITAEKFDAVITDLQMRNPAGGLAVVSAMRYSQPDVLTPLAGYPNVQSAMAAIRLEPDRIIVKLFGSGALADRLHGKMVTCCPNAEGTSGSDTGALHYDIVADRLVRAKQNTEQGPQPALAQHLL